MHDTAVDGPARSGALVDRVRAEFREMPGLRLTLGQAARLWQLDDLTCAAVLHTLVRDRFLFRTPAGTFMRTDQR